MAFAAARARGSMASAPSKSKALIMSMMSRAIALSSGALPWRSPFLALGRGIERRGETRFAAEQRFPGELDAVAPAFGDELKALGAQRHHVGLAFDVHFAAQRFFQ